MKKALLLLGMASQLCITTWAQVAQPVLPPGKIAVFKAGTSDGIWPIVTSRVQPCYVQVFDPVTNNQTAPLVSVPMSTNASVPGSVWINAHAGSEGGGISRSTDRSVLALQGYTGNILTPTSAKSSTDPTVHRGIVTLDAFANPTDIYSDLNNWFGIPYQAPTGTQDNPTGIATTDGQSFWGTGNFAGTSAELDGTLFYNASLAPEPVELQNYIQAAAQARIIGGTLYIVVPGGSIPGAIYNFVQTSSQANPGQVVPLPYDPDVANPYETTANPNTFLSFGSTYQTIANFDMNPEGTVVYAADQTYGIVKYTNNAGVWVQAPYIFGTTNLGTTVQGTAQQGCFGICVDFTGTNPVIYATTMEYDSTAATSAKVDTKVGNPNRNRLIRIVDTGVNPGTSLVAVTLATAPSTNEVFRGIDFTPDLRPLVISAPSSVSAVVGSNATFGVTVQSVYDLSYQWQQNGTNLLNATNSTLTLSNLTTTLNNDTYQCIAANSYGIVTSAPPATLTVTLTPLPPTITSAVGQVSGYIGNSVTFAPVVPGGTQPFTYQWYQGTTALVDDGVNIIGSSSNSLTLANLTAAEAGGYYLAVTNEAGGIEPLVDVLSVNYQKPSINPGGQPVAVTTFAGLSASLSVTPSGGTQPFTYQWYTNYTLITKTTNNTIITSFTNSLTTALSDLNDFSGSATNSLTISPASVKDAGSYSVVISNVGGSVTSLVVAVTVLVPPAHSSVSYSNQLYVQNFDSLPDPGTLSVNSINNPQDAGSIKGIVYSLANPFDFAYPVIANGYVGGLGLSNTLSGWYGACDGLPYITIPDGIARFGAQDGDQSTGGIIDFGLDDNENDSSIIGTNRALGLQTTSTTGSTTFGLKLVNSSTQTLNYVDIGFTGELWRNNSGHRTMTFGYTLDNNNSFVLSPETVSNVTDVASLSFSFPTNLVVENVDGTSPANQTNLVSTNLALASPWAPGATLWLTWSMDYYGSGGGNGYAIDNLNFLATANPLLSVTQPVVGGVSYNKSNKQLSLTFTNTAGAAAQFTVWATTNLTLPSSKWLNLGSPAEVSPGAYQFTDLQSTNKPQQFYRIEAISPQSF